MKLNLLVLLPCITTTFASFCAADDTAPVRYDVVIKSSIEYGEDRALPTHLSQEDGKIYLQQIRPLDIAANHDLRLIVDRIHRLCLSQDPSLTSSAEKLLAQLTPETDSEKLHYCAALIRLGEAYLKDPNTRDQAISYLSEAARTHNFTGALHMLGIARCYDNPDAALYYTLRAQKASLNLKLKFDLTEEDIQQRLNKNPKLQTTQDVLTEELLLRLIYLTDKEASLERIKTVLKFEEEEGLYSLPAPIITFNTESPEQSIKDLFWDTDSSESPSEDS